MKVTSKGQVTIPQEIREKTGLLPNTEVEFVMSGKQVVIRKAKGARRGRSWLANLVGKGDIKLSTDEIMAMTRGE